MREPEFDQAVKEFLSSVSAVAKAVFGIAENKILERLIEPDRVIQFRVTWVDDAGRVQINRAWRVKFNAALGPYKGGLRFHPTVNLSILKFLGFEQIFKNALTGLPLGGGKGGSDFDPKGKSEAEVERFCRAFMAKLAPYIGYNLDVPAGDIGVGGREIKYMLDEYFSISKNPLAHATLTGKAVADKGRNIPHEATGHGLLYFVA